MSAQYVEKRPCTACESRRTAARCSGCQAPLCRECKKANTLCDTCIEYYSAMVEPTEREIRRRTDHFIYGVEELTARHEIEIGNDDLVIYDWARSDELGLVGVGVSV